ncbi:phosphoribosyltransferase [Jatrophihabitans sp.]|uniref:phosphoribosyltransferase n=1 Tax=Jatrophihabitans sp. TaxID=1932789 RepID=UPI0030C7182D|nr:hypothetical protein [Jatrophihabitans sp.]
MTDGWVPAELGVELHGRDGQPLGELVQVALRRNARRSHLLVSTVLGKHIPTDPGTVHEAGRELGRRVSARLGEPPALVIGFAETATALGHCVAECLGADYLHSTRRAVAGLEPVGGFEEAHSHATGHLLLPEWPEWLSRSGPVVLVDDEFSTGSTALNTIAELQRICPRDRYVLATLVDLRSAADQARIDDEAQRLDTAIDVVYLGGGSISWPEEFPARAAEIAARPPASSGEAVAPLGELVRTTAGWPAWLRESGRHGITAADTAALQAAADRVADELARSLAGDRVLLLGFEELMYLPLLVALGLRWHADVEFSTTTRSPIVVLDEPGYPIRRGLTFAAHDHPSGGGSDDRFAYNIVPGRYTDIVLVVDEPGDTAALDAGLLPQLRALAGRVHVVTIPSYRLHTEAHPQRLVPSMPSVPLPLRSPEFGSYAPDEVSWLLTDLSDVALEAPVEEREEAIQSGGAHYAESLPIEYQPTPEYQELFAAALAESATRVARAVGLVTELVLAERGSDVVLASLARAGTPVGVLMRRWARRRGLELPHYALSIVRGRGIDTVALAHLAERYDPARVVFVDGWTGKGAIARELAVAVSGLARSALGGAFDPQLAVLADTGSCVSLYGTREDFLIPSACLNSTVSGLVSRTVLNPAILRPDQFHGAKFYRELADSDVSTTFLDAISAEFETVAAEVEAALPQLQAADRSPTWAGWRAVEEISEAWGIHDVNLVKPGVGETTRVLLRRVPWRVLVRPDATADLAHVLLLAEQRGVEITPVADLAYSCVGLIHPGYTRAAIGSDGLRAAGRPPQ